MLEVFINGVSVDIEDKTDIKLNFENSDDDNFTSFKCNYSENFTLPHTAKNDELFGYLHILTLPFNQTIFMCDLYYMGNILDSGSCNVLKVDSKGYTVRFVSKSVDFFKQMEQYTVGDFLATLKDTNTTLKHDYASATTLFNGTPVADNDLGTQVTIGKLIGYTGVYENGFDADKKGVTPYGETTDKLEWQEFNSAGLPKQGAPILDYTGTKLAWYERQLYNNNVGRVFGELRMWQCLNKIKVDTLFYHVIQSLKQKGFNIEIDGSNIYSIIKKNESYNPYFIEMPSDDNYTPELTEIQMPFRNAEENTSIYIANANLGYDVIFSKADDLELEVLLPASCFNIISPGQVTARKQLIYIAGTFSSAPTYTGSIQSELPLNASIKITEDGRSVNRNITYSIQYGRRGGFEGLFDLKEYVLRNSNSIYQKGGNWWIKLPFTIEPDLRAAQDFTQAQGTQNIYVDAKFNTTTTPSMFYLRTSNDLINIDLLEPDTGFDLQSTQARMVGNPNLYAVRYEVNNTRSDTPFTIANYATMFPNLSNLNVKDYFLGMCKWLNLKLHTDILSDGSMRITVHKAGSVLDTGTPQMDITKYQIMDKEWSIEPASAYSHKTYFCGYEDDDNEKSAEYKNTFGEEYGAAYYKNPNGTIEETKELFRLPFRVAPRYCKKNNLFLGRAYVNLASKYVDKYSDNWYCMCFENDRKRVNGGIYIGYGKNLSYKYVGIVNDIPNSNYQSFRIGTTTNPAGTFAMATVDCGSTIHGMLLGQPRVDWEYEDVESKPKNYVDINGITDFIKERYNANTRRITCYMNFYDVDISNTFLRKPYIFDGVLVIIQSITEYSPITKVGKVVMYTINDVNNYLG